MQAQGNRTTTQAITQTQSLAATQLLLRAGLSCITFLRNLLPEENFTESHLTTADDSIPPSSSEGTVSSKGRNDKVNSFKIMTMMRGYTDEADRILNYLEKGIFDALGKQYLRSFIFAIYLDSNDPKNIVEAYTFNFKYHHLPGTDTVAPIMTLGDDLQRMTIGGSSRVKDPIAEAVQKGRLPTLREVKKSVKTMMKTLIQAITNMDELPRRRYATFKLFYNESTPDDYEPPNFQSGDHEKDRWFFMTHNLDEVPDRFSVGKMNSGYHSVNLKVTSIATYLPSSNKNDNALFTGSVNKGALPPNSADDAVTFAKQVEDQEDDARNRNLVWSAEDDLDALPDLDADADGEDDPDYAVGPDGKYMPVAPQEPDGATPIGLRNVEGQIEQIAVSGNGSIEALFPGFPEPVLTRLQDLNAISTPEISPYEETQVLYATQTLELDLPRPNTQSMPVFTYAAGPPASPLPPSNLAMELDSPISSILSTPSPSIRQVQGRKSQRLNYNEDEDDEMLDPETQPEDQGPDSIQSFCLDDKARKDDSDPITQTPKLAAAPSVKDVGLDCSCRITLEDQMCFCEAGCGRWYHVWCMGYHSARDPRLPTKFVCFDCRLRADVSWKLIEDDIYPTIMEKYRDFVTYRRAIKISEHSDTMTPTEFARALDDGNQNAARHWILQLEEDGFIQQVVTTFDAIGVATDSRTTRSKKANQRKGKQQQQRKNVQKTRYAFNKAIKSEPKYIDYFTPEQEVESRLLGLNDLRNFRTTTVSAAVALIGPGINGRALQESARMEETQTMDETMPETPPSHGSQKRGNHAVGGGGTVGEFEQGKGRGDADVGRPSKRQKISVATGIDLAE